MDCKVLGVAKTVIQFTCAMQISCLDFPDSSVYKESACNAGNPVQILGWEDMLEKG